MNCWTAAEQANVRPSMFSSQPDEGLSLSKAEERGQT